MAKKTESRSILYWLSLILIPVITILAVFTIWQHKIFSDVPYKNALHGCPIGTKKVEHNYERSGGMVFGYYSPPTCQAWLSPVFESLGL